MRAHRHPHGHVGAFDRRQRDARAARAQNDRRDDHVQSVKASCRKKARDCVGATFDQYPAHTASTQRSKDSRRRKVPIGSGQPDKLYARDRRSGISFRSYNNATDTILTEDPRFAAETAVRIDDDACRLLPGDPAYGQLRIIGYRSTDADNDRVYQSPQPVQVGQSGRPIDVFRMPRFRRNTAVERLADLADDHQLINGTPAKRAENFTPGLRKRLVTRPKNIAKLQPWVG
jgi:hypothetical protein